MTTPTGGSRRLWISRFHRQPVGYLRGVESTLAIVLRRHRLTETSLIVTWLAPDLGRLKTVAKGALRPRNRLGGVLDLFHLCEIQFQTARSGDLHTLREAVLIESYPGLRTEFTRVAAGAYAVEVIERATEKEAPVPEIFGLLQRSNRPRKRPSAILRRNLPVFWASRSRAPRRPLPWNGSCTDFRRAGKTCCIDSRSYKPRDTRILKTETQHCDFSQKLQTHRVGSQNFAKSGWFSTENANITREG